MNLSKNNEVNCVENPFNALDKIRNISTERIRQNSIFTCDLSEIIWKYNTWIHLFPKIKPFFGIKPIEYYKEKIILMIEYYQHLNAMIHQ